MVGCSLRRGLLAFALLAGLAVAGCHGAPEAKPAAPQAQPAEAGKPAQGAKEDPVKAARSLGTPTQNPVVTTASGLEYIDVKAGTGAEAKAGQTVSVHYTGWLVNGTKFDSSVDRGKAFEFKLGAGQATKGSDEGVTGMRPGGVRKLIVPPALGYGSRGAAGVIPPDATLIYEVELLAIPRKTGAGA